MSRAFPSIDGKWNVRVSLGRRITRSTVKESPKRQVVVQKTPSKAHLSEEWKAEVAKIIAASKRQTDLEARSMIGAIEKWQQETCARFDMIQQQLIYMRNQETGTGLSSINGCLTPVSDSPVDDDASTSNGSMDVVTSNEAAIIIEADAIEEAIGITKALKQLPETHTEETTEETIQNTSEKTIETVSLPSMPILFDTEESADEDNLRAFLDSPIIPVTKKVDKRRNTDTFIEPRQTMSEFLMRKRPRLYHSSILAKSNDNHTELMENPDIPVSTKSEEKPTNKDKRPTIKTKNAKPNQHENVEKLALYKKILETQKLMREAKKANLTASNGNTSNGQAYPKPVV